MCFVRFLLNCHSWNKYELVNEIFFLILPKTKERDFNNFNIGTVKMEFKRHLSSCTKLAKKKTSSINAIAVTLFSYFSFNLPAIQLYISTWEKRYEDISFSFTCFCYYRKHPNINNKIFPLPYSTCFQQQFHDWFFLLRYNSNLAKLEWTLLLFNFN